MKANLLCRGLRAPAIQVEPETRAERLLLALIFAEHARPGFWTGVGCIESDQDGRDCLLIESNKPNQRELTASVSRKLALRVLIAQGSFSDAEARILLNLPPAPTDTEKQEER